MTHGDAGAGNAGYVVIGVNRPVLLVLLTGVQWYNGRTDQPRIVRLSEPLAMSTPKAFISYSWDDEPHKDWVKALAARLRGEDVDVTLDRWAVAPGDQLPRFMETAVRENEFVLIVLTPNYKLKSDGRKGGVGYEGDIMTGEVFAGKDPRKFIPILRSGAWDESSPSWLGGKYGIDLSGDLYSEVHYFYSRRKSLPLPLVWVI